MEASRAVRMLLRLVLKTSSVTPNKPSQNSAFKPALVVLATSQVMFGFGATFWFKPLFSTFPSPRKYPFVKLYVDRYWNGSMASLPILPQEKRNLRKFMKSFFRKLSLEATQPTEIPGKRPHRLSFGKAEEPS